jgi:hypothetical protein
VGNVKGTNIHVDNRFLCTIVEIIFLNVFIIITTNKGDKGPCLHPQELLNKPVGVTFTNTEKCTDKIQCAIPLNCISLAYTTENPN